jgi:hypothetical protein
VIGLDFGTISSGFSSASNDENICYNDSWPFGFSYSGLEQKMKVSTTLQYGGYYEWVNLSNTQSRGVELFKLYLGDSPDNLKPKLPINYERAIKDYFGEIGKVSKCKKLLLLIFKLFTYSRKFSVHKTTSCKPLARN